MKNKNTSKREDFLKTLSSMTPEEVTNLIMENSKIKILSNIVTRIGTSKK